jgi:hypothetical protein
MTAKLFPCRAAQGTLGPLLIALGLAGLSACAEAEKARPNTSIQPTYDTVTGRLTELAYDSDGDGRADTWTDMDGARPVRSRLDTTGDGRIDRWEDYDERGGLARVGFSRAGNETPDAWAFPDADGLLHRIEISSSADEHRIDRWEYYEAAPSSPGGRALARAEEDTTGDGRPDKWETYAQGVISTVAFDETSDGRPDRRLTYTASGGVIVESQPETSGRFARRVEAR